MKTVDLELVLDCIYQAENQSGDWRVALEEAADTIAAELHERSLQLDA